jgi:hypothetical protein
LIGGVVLTSGYGKTTLGLYKALSGLKEGD